MTGLFLKITFSPALPYYSCLVIAAACISSAEKDIFFWAVAAGIFGSQDDGDDDDDIDIEICGNFTD